MKRAAARLPAPPLVVRVASANAGAGCLRRGGAAALFPARDAQFVVHVAHAGDRFDEVLGVALVVAAADLTGERHLAVGDGHFHLARIDPPVLGQALADVLADPLVGSAVALRSASGEVRSGRVRELVDAAAVVLVVAARLPVLLVGLRPVGCRPSLAIAPVLGAGAGRWRRRRRPALVGAEG